MEADNLDQLLDSILSQTGATKKIHLELPVRCKAKARPRLSKGKRRFYNPTSEREREISLLALEQMRENGWEPLKGKLKMSCIIHIKGKRRSDLSNYIKLIEDGLEGKGDWWPVCYYNDLQIGEYGQMKVVEHADEDLIVVDIEQVGVMK